MGILTGLTNIKPLEPCKVGRTLLDLDEDDRAILTKALEDPKWSGHALSNALRPRGIILAADTIRQHMQGACRCSKI